MNAELLKNLISTLEGVKSNPAFNACAEQDEQAGRSLGELSLWVTVLEEKVREADIPVIDLDVESYKSLLEAAQQSKWIPKEYWANDWIADARNFLIEGHPKPDFTPEMAVAAQKHIQKISKNMGTGLLALQMTASPSGPAFSKFPGVREEFWKNLFEVMVNAEKNQPTETISALQDRRQYVADAAFMEYDFEEVTACEAGGWEYTSPGREMTRKVYTDEGGAHQSAAINFTVTFSSVDSSSIESVSALDSESGQQIGRWGITDTTKETMRG